MFLDASADFSHELTCMKEGDVMRFYPLLLLFAESFQETTSQLPRWSEVEGSGKTEIPNSID